MATRTVRSVCPLDCPDRCSLDVDVDVADDGRTGRVLRIDGSRANPLTEGYICGKVRQFGAHRVHAAHRVLTPGIRVGPKGPGATFRPVSWEEAIGVIAERFRAIAAAHGWQAVWPYWYGGSNGWLTGGGMDQRLWNRLGTSRIGRTLCAANTGAGTKAVYGDLPSADPLDVDDADMVLLWGFNPSASGIHWVPKVRAAIARGARLVVVDPRQTPLAGNAHVHLAPLPGTDVALAMAMAHVAFADGLADRAFLARWAPDADRYEAACAAWTPERAAAVCGVDAGAIREAARLYAGGSPSLLRAGWGLERTRNGTDGVRAVLSLPAVFGKFGQRGGGWVLSTSAGYRTDPTRWQGAPGAPSELPRTLNMSQVGRVLDETRDPPIRALYVYDCNPVATAPDQARTVRALARDELFTVVHEQVHTDTVDYADVVLPATTFLEHRELVRSYGGYVVGWSEPAIPPVGEARSNHAVMVALARALGLDEPALTVSEDALAAEMAEVAGVSFDALGRDGMVARPRPVQFVDVVPSAPLSLAGDAPPRFLPPPSDAERPLVLISPASTRGISSTLFETLPAETAAIGLHPDDAAARGIADGATVRAWNSVGEVVLRAALDPKLRPGVASIAKGVWRSGTLNGFTSNALIPDHVDAVGQGACYNDARIEVAPVAGAR